MAPSSSAKKVAKLASRGKGKKVRFSSGTTFPTIVGAALIAMVALIAYSKATVPGLETGAPQPTDLWSEVYGIRVCDTYLPQIGLALALTWKVELSQSWGWVISERNWRGWLAIWV